MSINKNALMTVFFFLLALNSPSLFNALNFSKSNTINGTTVMYFLGAIILYFIHLNTNKKNTLSEEKGPIQKIIILGIIGIFASMFLQVILMSIEIIVFKQTVGSQNTTDIVGYVKKTPYFLLAVSIAGPIMEEYVFRFSLINFLNQKLDIWSSAVVSSLLFAVMHNDGHYLLYGGLGFFFFILYKKTGSIYTSMITHVGMNTVVMITQLMQK